MTGHNPKSEVLVGRERRRRRTPAEKLAIIAETMEPGMTVSLVARRHGIAPNQLFTWRRLANQGALTATQAEEDVVPASAYKALADQVRELQRLLGKKSMEAEILRILFGRLIRNSHNQYYGTYLFRPADNQRLARP